MNDKFSFHKIALSLAALGSASLVTGAALASPITAQEVDPALQLGSFASGGDAMRSAAPLANPPQDADKGKDKDGKKDKDKDQGGKKDKDKDQGGKKDKDKNKKKEGKCGGKGGCGAGSCG